MEARLRRAYTAAELDPPSDLDLSIVPQAVVWTIAGQVSQIRLTDRLIVRTHCPGELLWRLGDGPEGLAPLVSEGGVMAGVQRYGLILGPFAAAARLRFRLRCTHPDCDCHGLCCTGLEHAVEIVA